MNTTIKGVPYTVRALPTIEPSHERVLEQTELARLYDVVCRDQNVVPRSQFV